MVIVGDADGVRPEHAVAMFKLRGGGDEEAAATGMLTKVPAARLVILPGDLSHRDLRRGEGARIDGDALPGRRAARQPLALVAISSGKRDDQGGQQEGQPFMDSGGNVLVLDHGDRQLGLGVHDEVAQPADHVHQRQTNGGELAAASSAE